mgnify:CR=1 FL=1
MDRAGRFSWPARHRMSPRRPAAGQRGSFVPDIFDEVEEDLRAERMKRLLTRYGGLLAGLLLLVVIGVAGLQGWRWWQGRAAAQAAIAYLAAGRDAAQPGADLKAVAERYAGIAADAPAGYRALARLRAAALLAESGDRTGALAQWEEIARDGSIDLLYRDLATLMWGLHSLDSGDPAAIEARLAPLAEGNGPWRASAQEIRALAAIRRGETETARRNLAALAADPAAPQGVRERAGRLLQGIGG